MALATLSISRNMAESTEAPPATYTGEFSSASAIACSGGSRNLPSACSTYPDAACALSHSRTSRGLQLVFFASSSDVIGVPLAIARYSPSCSPRITLASMAAPPMSLTNLPINSFNLAWSISASFAASGSHELRTLSRTDAQTRLERTARVHV
jgi:hypothetical protein